MNLPWFEGLRSTGRPLADVRRFLRATQHLDTLYHAAQVNAAGRRLARRLNPPSPKGRGAGGEEEFTALDLACTAHDLAAVVPLREIVAAAERLGVPLSEADRVIPQVIHGPVAAVVLEQRLGVRDDDALNAVRHHTTLRAGASPLEQLVFIADKIALDSTTRQVGFHAALLAAKDTASLKALCLIYLDWAVHEGPTLGWRLHPNLLAAREELRR